LFQGSSQRPALVGLNADYINQFSLKIFYKKNCSRAQASTPQWLDYMRIITTDVKTICGAAIRIFAENEIFTNCKILICQINSTVGYHIHNNVYIFGK
jgi:hypothetical protein